MADSPDHLLPSGLHFSRQLVRRSDNVMPYRSIIIVTANPPLDISRRVASVSRSSKELLRTEQIPKLPIFLNSHDCNMLQHLTDG